MGEDDVPCCRGAPQRHAHRHLRRRVARGSARAVDGGAERARCGPRPGTARRQYRRDDDLPGPGLQDALVPDFEHRTGYRAKVTAQGTGAVLALAAKGDVDAILVHEPRQELAFMERSGARRDPSCTTTSSSSVRRVTPGTKDGRSRTRSARSPRRSAVRLAR